MNPTEKAIEVRGLSKHFRIHKREHNLKRIVINSIRGHTEKNRKLRVLDGVSFSVDKGEFFGVVGRNGSGKSTLLKILAGVYVPGSGVVEVNGRLTPFIELGVGFNHELTGRDNVFLNGALLGFSHEEMNLMYEDIVNFAELQDFMDEKLKNYSSGMQVRLAFSIAIRANTDILLIDEVLAVGDARFQRKCYEIFKKFKSEGKTIIFVSHSMSQIVEFCDRAVVIDSGRIVFNGNPNKATKVYERLNKTSGDELKDSGTVLADDFSYRKGNGKAKIGSVSLNKKVYSVNDNLEMSLSYKVDANIRKMFYGLSIYKSDRVQSVFALSGALDPRHSKLNVYIPKLALTPGKYFVSVGLTGTADNWKDPYDHMEKNFSFRVHETKNNSPHNIGPIYMETKVSNES